MTNKDKQTVVLALIECGIVHTERMEVLDQIDKCPSIIQAGLVIMANKIYQEATK